MAEAPSIYLDSCCFIDLARQVKGIVLTKERSSDAWYSRKLIQAAKDGNIKLFTSAFTQVECVGVREKEGANVPMIFDADVRRLFDAILASGRSGVIPVQPSYFITKAARDLYWDGGVPCKPADRLHLATAISVGCTEFLTADGRINKMQRKQLTKRFGLAVLPPKETSALPSEYRQLLIDDATNVSTDTEIT